jgi:hypothetical protein
MRSSLRRGLLAAYLSLCAPIAGQAAEFSIFDLMNSLSQVKESRASFVEEKHLAALTEPLRSRGDLDYRAPAHLVKRTVAPIEETIEVDGSQLSIARPSEGKRQSLSLDSYPDIKVFVVAIRATLAGDLDTLRQSYEVGFSGTAQAWELTLVPRSRRVREFLRVVLISGTGQQMTRMEMIEGSGDTSLMTIQTSSGAR